VDVAALEDRPQPAHFAMTVDEVTDDTLEEWLAMLRIGNDMATPDAAATEWARASWSHDCAGLPAPRSAVGVTLAYCHAVPHQDHEVALPLTAG
jgi:hypothetical protein